MPARYDRAAVSSSVPLAQELTHFWTLEVKPASLQKQLESELSLHFVRVKKVFRQLGRTPGAGAGCTGELGADGGADGAVDLTGATHLVHIVEVDVVVIVETVEVVIGVVAPAGVVVIGQVVTVVETLHGELARFMREAKARPNIHLCCNNLLGRARSLADGRVWLGLDRCCPNGCGWRLRNR